MHYFCNSILPFNVYSLLSFENGAACCTFNTVVTHRIVLTHVMEHTRRNPCVTLQWQHKTLHIYFAWHKFVGKEDSLPTLIPKLHNHVIILWTLSSGIAKISAPDDGTFVTRCRGQDFLLLRCQTKLIYGEKSRISISLSVADIFLCGSFSDNDYLQLKS